MKKQNLVFILFICIAIFFGFEEYAQAAPVEFNGHYYECIYDSLSFNQAKIAAETRSYQGVTGHLATITSPEENQFAYSLIASSQPIHVWIGGYQLPNSVEPDGGWVWITGEQWNWTNWYSGEPNNSYSGELYLVMLPNLAGTWNDVTSDCIAAEYLVEYDTTNNFKILSPQNNSELQMQEISTTNLNINWTPIAGAKKYVISLDDLYSNNTILRNKEVHETEYNIPLTSSYNRNNNRYHFNYGHKYTLTVTAVDLNGKTYDDTVTFKIKVLPDLMGQAYSMDSLEHNGLSSTTWDGCVQELESAKKKLNELLKVNYGWHIYEPVNSAYRPVEFQEHYYLIFQNLKDKNLEVDDRNRLIDEINNAHHIVFKPAYPSADAPHSQGIAFDANVVDSHGKPINSRNKMPNSIKKLLPKAGLCNPPTSDGKEDGVHFELQLQHKRH